MFGIWYVANIIFEYLFGAQKYCLSMVGNNLLLKYKYTYNLLFWALFRQLALFNYFFFNMVSKYLILRVHFLLKGTPKWRFSKRRDLSFTWWGLINPSVLIDFHTVRLACRRGSNCVKNNPFAQQVQKVKHFTAGKRVTLYERSYSKLYFNPFPIVTDVRFMIVECWRATFCPTPEWFASKPIHAYDHDGTKGHKNVPLRNFRSKFLSVTSTAL